MTVETTATVVSNGFYQGHLDPMEDDTSEEIHTNGTEIFEILHFLTGCFIPLPVMFLYIIVLWQFYTKDTWQRHIFYRILLRMGLLDCIHLVGYFITGVGAFIDWIDPAVFNGSSMVWKVKNNVHEILQYLSLLSRIGVKAERYIVESM
ncbi:hypothetical protein AB6A40_010433 [Gnathostoma spinigerum]|uniref:Uncharacterized protein n=1 Tax=Gnathostoma spinigerum TaxID=75299 RepID=A0ABD6EZQ8_9BILA